MGTIHHWMRWAAIAALSGGLLVALSGCELDSSGSDASAADGAAGDGAAGDAAQPALVAECAQYVDCCTQLGQQTNRANAEENCRAGAFDDLGNDPAQCAQALAECETLVGTP